MSLLLKIKVVLIISTFTKRKTKTKVIFFNDFCRKLSVSNFFVLFEKIFIKFYFLFEKTFQTLKTQNRVQISKKNFKKNIFFLKTISKINFSKIRDFFSKR